MGHLSACATITVRRMEPRDVPDVAAIERVAFVSGWPATAFERELQENKIARYVVLERTLCDSAPAIVAFGGLWLQLDEAHVVTVAVRREHRRVGYGLVVVRALLDLARAEGMQVATLEVRLSNEAARRLYRRCGFHEVGERKRYYADNGEDAIIMTTEEFDSPGFQRHYSRLDEAIAARFASLRSTVV
ncbi:MAG: ribosomal protein S18-alanine N-acetyltransferase [Dehalococcoidia bacterium]|nr:ribosomal protein S18-alanine N-acetyltransferase [Dehalococcoidia bacterium]